MNIGFIFEQAKATEDISKVLDVTGDMYLEIIDKNLYSIEGSMFFNESCSFEIVVYELFKEVFADNGEKINIKDSSYTIDCSYGKNGLYWIQETIDDRPDKFGTMVKQDDLVKHISNLINNKKKGGK